MKGSSMRSNKLNIYASFAFDLKKLRELRRNYPVPPQNKVDEIVKDIDLLIRPKFYLLGPAIISRNQHYKTFFSIIFSIILNKMISQ